LILIKIQDLTHSDIEKRLKAIIETAIDGIITIDDRGHIESANIAAAKLFNYKVEELIGQKVNMLMNSNDAHHHDQYIANYFKSGIAKIIGIGREVKGKKKDGTIFWFRLAVSEVKLNNRTIFTGIIHDLSDIKKAQQEVMNLNQELETKVQQRTNELEKVVNQLLQTNQDLKSREAELADALQREKELNELKSRFVSMASHEFRTPLSTVLSSASLIAKYTSHEQQGNRVKHIEKIKKSVDHLTTILNDFLSLSKLEEGQFKCKPEDIDLIKLISELIEEIKGLLPQDQKINFQFEDHLIIESDTRIMTHVVFNLLSNAIKYSHTTNDINVVLENMDNKVILHVQDHGIGIPLEDQKYIFTRFFRAANVENIQGTGLGLNIVKSYVELLGGQIYFKSIPGEGSQFSVEIPKIWKNPS